MAGKGKEEKTLVGLQTQGSQGLDLWFYDSGAFSYGSKLAIKVKNVLCHYRSAFQEIAVFETEKLGRMLVLDSVTMLTEFDEFAYHEMIAHVPMTVHPHPSRVLVIGGGDGGTVREVLKHPEVTQVHLCEIDPEVIAACRKYLPAIASGLDDPKVEVFTEDGALFVKKHPGTYDVIIVDSTDPFGPGQVLFQRPFYADMKHALAKEGGIVVTQCESLYFHKEVIREVGGFAKKLYDKTGYYYTNVPTYPSGMIGFYFCSTAFDPVKGLDAKRAARLPDLKYYSPEVHQAAFVLPRFAQDYLK
jgi:spermidine synthase